MPRLLVATTNPGKLREFRQLLAGLPCQLVSPPEVGVLEAPAESGTSLEENARSKALFYYERSGLLTLAEDSGLEVAALGGEPGVRSARFAGAVASDQENIRLLLERLEGVPLQQRTARFRSVIAVAGVGDEVRLFSGEVRGLIALSAHGGAGFGYDPVFLVPELGRTFAQLSPVEKHRISHRGQAARRAAAFLAGILGGVQV